MGPARLLGHRSLGAAPRMFLETAPARLLKHLARGGARAACPWESSQGALGKAPARLLGHLSLGDACQMFLGTALARLLKHLGRGGVAPQVLGKVLGGPLGCFGFFCSPWAKRILF